MPSRMYHFSARVLQQGPNPYIVAPEDVSAAFRRYTEKGRVRVFGTLQGVEIRGNLVPRGGRQWLFLHGGMRAAAGVGVGDEVEVALRATTWDDVPLARDARAALRASRALDAFEALSPSERHELLRWVDVAETAAKRAQRIAALVEQIQGRTRPLKRGRAGRRLEPLWTCPKCGHRFVNKNQWHSCKRYTLDQVFADESDEVRALFEHVRAMVESVGPVHLQAYRDHVAFLVRVRFLGATPKKKWLDLGFWLPRRIDSPRFRKVETLTPTDHIHLLRVRSEEDLDDEVMSWIREGYRVGEQRHLE